MVRIILDAPVGARFRGVREAELCDESGEILGRFLSEEAYRRRVYDRLNAQVTDEELERSFQQPGGRTLGEIWGRLERQ